VPGLPLITIFGAAVRPGGEPSAALLRRIGYGWRAAQAHPDASLLLSGGVGRHGPSEASIMAEHLARGGVSPERLILDEASLDTLQSVVVASRLARARGAAVLVVSDGYHIPRIRLMLSALGVPSAAAPAPAGRFGPSLGHRLGMSLRECAAIPYDLAIVLARRNSLAS
jgi:uncharacterized SAM-binding protein YcdF (DUF218 family)